MRELSKTDKKRMAKVLRRAAELIADGGTYTVMGTEWPLPCCYAISLVGRGGVNFLGKPLPTRRSETFQEIHGPDVEQETHYDREAAWWPNYSPTSQVERTLLLLLTAEAIEAGDL